MTVQEEEEGVEEEEGEGTGGEIAWVGKVIWGREELGMVGGKPVAGEQV